MFSLKTSDSSLRINLYGQLRPVKKPAITPPAMIKPWAMGTNPISSTSEINKNGYNNNNY